MPAQPLHCRELFQLLFLVPLALPPLYFDLIGPLIILNGEKLLSHQSLRHPEKYIQPLYIFSFADKVFPNQNREEPYLFSLPDTKLPALILELPYQLTLF